MGVQTWTVLISLIAQYIIILHKKEQTILFYRRACSHFTVTAARDYSSATITSLQALIEH